MELETYFGTIEVRMKISFYRANTVNIMIGLSENTDGGFESYGNLTVNLGDDLPFYHAYIDVNNIPAAEDFIKKYHLAENTGQKKRSGFVEYPLYKFNAERLQHYDNIGMYVYQKKNSLI